MKDLILVRHGEAEHLVRGMTGGWTDLPLTELGRIQSAQAGERLSGLLSGTSFKLFGSDLVRARQTAEIIGRAVQQAPTLTPALRDANNGIAAHLTRAEAKKIKRPMTQPLMDWVPFPEAESWRMMMGRVVSFLAGLPDGEARPEVVVLVTHRNVISAIVQWWLGLPDEVISTTDFEAYPGSLALLTVSYWGGRTVVKVNDTAHLQR